MLYAATCLQLCCITSATLMSQEYHKTIQTSRGSEAILQKKYRYFKNFPPFYRNSSVTKSPKTLQLCCASRQNQPSATGSAHFSGRSVAFRFVYLCIYMRSFAYQSFCVRFCGALLCSLLRSFPVERFEAAVQCPAPQLLYKKAQQKRPLHKNVQRPLTIQAMLLKYAQGQAITEQPLLPRSA